MTRASAESSRRWMRIRGTSFNSARRRIEAPSKRCRPIKSASSRLITPSRTRSASTKSTWPGRGLRRDRGVRFPVRDPVSGDPVGDCLGGVARIPDELVEHPDSRDRIEREHGLGERDKGGLGGLVALDMTVAGGMPDPRADARQRAADRRQQPRAAVPAGPADQGPPHHIRLLDRGRRVGQDRADHRQRQHPEHGAHTRGLGVGGQAGEGVLNRVEHRVPARPAPPTRRPARRRRRVVAGRNQGLITHGGASPGDGIAGRKTPAPGPSPAVITRCSHGAHLVITRR